MKKKKIETKEEKFFEKKLTHTGLFLILILIAAIAAIHYLALGPGYGLSIEGSKAYAEMQFWKTVAEQTRENPPTPPNTCKCIAFLTPRNDIYLKQLPTGFERACKSMAAELREKGYIAMAFLPSECPKTVSEFKKKYTS